MKSHLARNTLLAASAALLTAGCATQNPPPSPHVHRGVEPSSHPAAAMGVEGGMRMQMNQQMEMMKQVHEKMAAAKSDAERHALMSEHMQMMHTMMESMMNRMDAMPAK
jgi:hypothetical protein